MSGGGTASPRHVITGIGAVAPTGLTCADYWSAVLRGESGIRTLTRFDPSGYSATVAGEIPEYTASRYVPGRLLPQTDRMTRLALIAAEEALADAGADPSAMPPFACGAVTAASAGGFEFGQKELEALWSKGGKYVSAYQSFAWFYPVNTGQISIRHGLRGPGAAVVAEQAGGLDAIAKARRHIRSGTPLMVTGGVDGSLSPWSWLCLIRSGRMSASPDPEAAFLPFDRRAQGAVVGEGGALLVMEDAERARERGASHRYGEVAGYAATFDPRPGSGRPPGLRRAITMALADAGMAPADVDVVFADAYGVPALDAAEAEALAGVFGPRGVPVTAPKTMTGRLLAGSAPLDVATALLSIRDGVLPPTVHVASPAHEHLLDLVRDAPREQRVSSALVVSRGQGGFNSALVVRAAA
ncbi:beta-ketoacyl synthase N-terminal-like domain-containing protein [Streptomyces boncukensis]|uniref:Ketosynthase chain-length factor n=1 Tax=Streptomyces boncukensis TaxID=2711219 RepID=A0A6G4WQQ0_9ACTN|nr:ketosynthase chain-length factor [Streptomyces boncukensis]